MQKKITSFLIFVVIILNMCTVPAFAGTVLLPSVTVGSAIGEKGDIVEIPIILKNNTGFANLGIEIVYDSEAITLTEVEPNPSVGGSFTPAQNYAKKPYNMSWDSAGNINFNGTLATLTFEIVTDKNGTYPITIDYYKGRNGDYIDGKGVNYDENFKSLNLTYTGGKIEVVVNNSITLNPDLTVFLSGNVGAGKIYAAIYGDNNKMKQAKFYTPAESFNLEFESRKKGDKIKVLWWSESAQPLCESKSIIIP